MTAPSQSPETIRQYARRQGAARLDRLAYEMGRNCKSADIEAVHDLRVSIRRLVSCLKAFPEFFSSAGKRKVRRRLREIMALAGEVRDRDIAIELGRQAGLPEGSELLAKLAGERTEAARRLRLLLKHSVKRSMTDKWRDRLGL